MNPTRTRLTLDGSGVELVATAAEKHAVEHGHRVVIAVVDASGTLLHLRQTPGAQAASSRVAVDKARTAAIFVRPSREIEAQVSAGRLGALALHGAVALTGGIPLVVDGQVVGAIGTSGETPDEDEAISIAGAAVALPRIEVAALTFDGARIAAEAAGAESARRGVAPVVAVVDAGGELVYVHRPDAAQVASVGVATDKARTASIYRRPSKDFEDQATGGRPSALHLHGAVPLQGGIPLVVDGTVVGAIGVSGASSADEDQELAVLGAAAFDVAVADVPARHARRRRRHGRRLRRRPPRRRHRRLQGRRRPADRPRHHRAPRPGHRRDVRARGPGHGRHRRRRRQHRPSSLPATCSSSRRRCRTRSPRSAIRSATSSSR